MINMSIHGKIKQINCFLMLALFDIAFVLIVAKMYNFNVFDDLLWMAALIVCFATGSRYECGIGFAVYASKKYSELTVKTDSSFQCVLLIVAISLLPFLLYFVDDALFTELTSFLLFPILWYIIFGPLVAGMVIVVVREIEYKRLSDGI